MNPTRLSTQNALRSCTGASNERPAAINVDRLMRWEAGEKEAAVTPDFGVLRQKVVGRTVPWMRLFNHTMIFFFKLTKWGRWTNEFTPLSGWPRRKSDDVFLCWLYEWNVNSNFT